MLFRSGFAGFLSCLMTVLYNKPSIITEHGIYIQEREIELSVAGWLDEFYLQKMWINCFKSLTKWEYKTVTKLITLYQGNKQLEIKYGADEKKIDVIPNGIKISRFTDKNCFIFCVLNKILRCICLKYCCFLTGFV